MIKKSILKLGRLIYRLLGLSVNQRGKKAFRGAIIDAQKANELIYNIIESGKPAMISRLGIVEANTLLNYLEVQEWKKTNIFSKINACFNGSVAQFKPEVKMSLQMNAGFFPNTNEDVEKFSAFFLGQIKKIDLLGIWRFVPGESFFHKHFCPNAMLFYPEALEPYYFSNPWSMALKGKRVLVIHPFSESIIKQYNIREFIFKDQNVLPSFELITIAAVQSIAGNKTKFNNWFEALEYMKFQINNIEFDVALIGAGSYGLPLAAYVKDRGKIAIHMGGAIQILFGIKGKRWDNHPFISKMYNEYWVRPDFSEIVPDSEKVESGCYW
jgi:hypothetical protein